MAGGARSWGFCCRGTPNHRTSPERAGEGILRGVSQDRFRGWSRRWADCRKDFAVRTRKRPSLSEGLCKEPTLHFTESRSIRISSDGHMALRVERNVTDPSTLLQPYKWFSHIRLRQSVFDVSRLSRNFEQLLIMLCYSKTARLSFYRWKYFYRTF